MKAGSRKAAESVLLSPWRLPDLIGSGASVQRRSSGADARGAEIVLRATDRRGGAGQFAGTEHRERRE
jgi:hypothetical protein